MVFAKAERLFLGGIERLFLGGTGTFPREVDTTAALQERKILLESARESIKIVSAEIPNLDDLKVALDRGVKVEVIVGQANNVMDFIPLLKKGVGLYELSEKPSEQYDIVDSNHVRLEILRGDGPGQQFIVHPGLSEPFTTEYLGKFRTLKEEAEER